MYVCVHRVHDSVVGRAVSRIWTQATGTTPHLGMIDDWGALAPQYALCTLCDALQAL